VNAELLTMAADLAEVVRLVDDDDVVGVLHRIVTRGVRTIPGCDQAMIVTRSVGQVEVIASARDDKPDVRQDGPIIEALAFREPRRLSDTAHDQRWPAFSAALAEQGYRSCLVLPLPSRSDPTAVLAMYSTQPEQFAELSTDLVLLFALHTGVAFDNIALYQDSRQLIEQLQNALRTRALIGSAQGILMHRNSQDTAAAFDALRMASQNRNVKLRDLAAQVVSAQESGDLEAALETLGLAARSA
jgi:GAF domain-containing protein